MRRKAFKILVVTVYLAGILAVLAITSYLSFSQFVRRGVTPVPELVGLTEDEAMVRASDQGLRLRLADEPERYADDVPAGRIALQEPAAGSLVKRGAPIEVVMSKGPQTVEVPSLLGQSFQAARVRVVEAGLVLGRTGEIFARGVEPGAVAEQHPPPGSIVDRSTAVHLLVVLEESGETFVMPDLVYRDYDRVRRIFERRGFRLGSVKFEPYEGVEPGIVLRQHPLAGHPLRRQDVVSLVVAAEPRPEEARR